jgi:cardiolipin synthase (CMP-forming)
MNDQLTTYPQQQQQQLLTIPNLLTFTRLLLIPFFILATIGEIYTLALVLFVSAAVTDILDGYIARKLNQHSRLGAILDPAADKTMMFSGYVLYTFWRPIPVKLPGWLTGTLFARDALIIFFAYLLYTRVQIRRFPPSIAGKVTTVFQVIALSATIAANTILQPLMALLLPVVLPATLLLTVYSGIDYLRRGEAMLALREEAGS